MGLANPWLLLGLAALAVPVLVHLVLREDRSGRAFPSLMFVRRIPFELKRRRKLRDLALLALRCLALAAIVLAFAAPYLDPGEPPATASAAGRDTVWLLDRSYSMSHPDRWDRAVAEVGDRIEALAPGERAALVVFDDQARVVAGPTSDRVVLRSALAGVEPSSGGTSLASAFAAADAILAHSEGGSGGIVLVSDLQRSALDAGGAMPLGASVTLEMVAINAPVGANATVVDARLAARDDDGVEDSLAVRVRNTGNAPLDDATLDLEVDDRVGGSRPLALPAGGEQTVTYPVVLAADRPTRITLRVGPDGLPADDSYHAVLMSSRPVVAALIEPDLPRAHHGVFIEEALGLASAPAIDVRRVHADAIDGELLDAVDVLILDDVSLPSTPAARAVAAFVERGGGVFVAAGPSLGAAPPSPGDGFLARAFGPAKSREGAGAHLEVAAGDHPLWSAVDAGTSLAGARINAARRVTPEPGDRVLARLSDGAPLLVEHAAGAGRILALATTADPRWGTLALEPGFVPLAQTAVAHLAGGSRWRATYVAGEVVDLARHAGSLPGTSEWREHLAGGGGVVVELPGGGTVDLQRPDNGLFRTELPGIHEAHRADGRGAALPFAVNVGRAESILTAASPGEIERVIVRRSRSEAAEQAASPARATLFGPWWWLLALASAALMGESVLSRQISKRRSAAAGTGP